MVEANIVLNKQELTLEATQEQKTQILPHSEVADNPAVIQEDINAIPRDITLKKRKICLRPDNRLRHYSLCGRYIWDQINIQNHQK